MVDPSDEILSASRQRQLYSPLPSLLGQKTSRQSPITGSYPRKRRSSTHIVCRGEGTGIFPYGPLQRGFSRWARDTDSKKNCLTPNDRWFTVFTKSAGLTTVATIECAEGRVGNQRQLDWMAIDRKLQADSTHEFSVDPAIQVSQTTENDGKVPRGHSHPPPVLGNEGGKHAAQESAPILPGDEVLPTPQGIQVEEKSSPDPYVFSGQEIQVSASLRWFQIPKMARHSSVNTPAIIRTDRRDDLRAGGSTDCTDTAVRSSGFESDGSSSLTGYTRLSIKAPTETDSVADIASLKVARGGSGGRR